MSTQHIHPVIQLLHHPAFLAIDHDLQSQGFLSLLGMTHTERWHSAFLAWLINPRGSHDLGDFPLKRLLTAVRTTPGDVAQMPWMGRLPPLAIIEAADIAARVTPDASNPDRRSEHSIGLSPEDRLAPANSKSAKERGRGSLDVCAACTLTVGGTHHRLLLIVEVKVNANEGKEQTVDYAKWALDQKYDTKRQEMFDGLEGSVIEHHALLYVAPGDKTPASKDFAAMDYERVVTEVLAPCTGHPSLSAQGRMLIDEYLRNLAGAPGTDRIAMSPAERSRVGRLWGDKNCRAGLAILEAHDEPSRFHPPPSAAPKVGTLKQLVEARSLHVGTTLRYRRGYIDRRVTLVERRGEIGIEVDGEVFPAPSSAAKAILGGQVCRGWDRFTVEDAGQPGDGQTLDALRQSLPTSQAPVDDNKTPPLDSASQAFLDAVIARHRGVLRVIAEALRTVEGADGAFLVGLQPEGKARKDYALLLDHLDRLENGRFLARFVPSPTFVAEIDLSGQQPTFYVAGESGPMSGSAASQLAAKRTGTETTSGAYQWSTYWQVAEGKHRGEKFIKVLGKILR